MKNTSPVSNQSNDSAVSEWVGLHYGLHWPTLSNERRQEFRVRYALILCEAALRDHLQYGDGESLERDAYNAACNAMGNP